MPGSRERDFGCRSRPSRDELSLKSGQFDSPNGYAFPATFAGVGGAEGYTLTVNDVIQAVGDFDGNGYADIVVSNYGSGNGSGSMAILGHHRLSNSAWVAYDSHSAKNLFGTWSANEGYRSPIFVGDFDGDGAKDLILPAFQVPLQ